MIDMSNDCVRDFVFVLAVSVDQADGTSIEAVEPASVVVA